MAAKTITGGKVDDGRSGPRADHRDQKMLKDTQEKLSKDLRESHIPNVVPNTEHQGTFRRLCSDDTN